jgi:hypothetical protein
MIGDDARATTSLPGAPPLSFGSPEEQPEATASNVETHATDTIARTARPACPSTAVVVLFMDIFEAP